MDGFKVKSSGDKIIRFKFYREAAPNTVQSFIDQLPFSRVFIHARYSGSEIWTADAPSLNIIQENASVFVEPGEVVIGPAEPLRNKASGCMGIYYGEGKGFDACNIFAKVFEEDTTLLRTLGEHLWKYGEQEFRFEILTEL